MSIRPNKGNRNIIVGGGMYVYENVSSPYREKDTFQAKRIINTKKKSSENMSYQLIDQYANTDLSINPQYISIDNFGQLIIYLSNTSYGNKLIISGPPIENWVDVSIKQTSFTDTTIHSWNNTLTYNLGEVTITIPKTTNTRGFIVIEIIPITQESS